MATRSRAPQAEVVSVRRLADKYEVEVQSPNGFSLRAFDPVLRIGPSEVHEYRESPTVGEYGVVYTLPAKEFEALPEGSEIRIGYGNNFVRATSYGNLNKQTLAVTR